MFFLLYEFWHSPHPFFSRCTAKTREMETRQLTRVILLLVGKKCATVILAS